MRRCDYFCRAFTNLHPAGPDELHVIILPALVGRLGIAGRNHEAACFALSWNPGPSGRRDGGLEKAQPILGIPFGRQCSATRRPGHRALARGSRDVGAMKCRWIADTPMIFSLPPCAVRWCQEPRRWRSRPPPPLGDDGRTEACIGHAGDFDTQHLFIERDGDER